MGYGASRSATASGVSPTDTLFFAAGSDEESHGLYGRIDPIPNADDDQGDDDNDQ